MAKHLASKGARQVLVGTRRPALNTAVAEVLAAGAPGAWASRCNVANETRVAATVQGALAKFSRLDVVVNNAGLMEFKGLEKLTGAAWNRVLGVDLLGTFYFIKQAFLHMKPGGSIVKVASIHAVAAEALAAPYAAAKAAVLSLTRSAAIEGKAKGLRVDAVLPGAIDTPMLWDNPNVKAEVEKLTAPTWAVPKTWPPSSPT